MEEPAGTPSARCKTSLASIYGLMSETSPAFHLPVSPLVRSLLDDTNLALSKFLADQTVHGFLPVPSRRHRRYYRTSSSSFPGPYSVPPGVTSITLKKASEARKRSVSLSASQVSSMETMLSGVCEVSSWLDWWLSTCGGFREHLPDEVRADFERLILSGSRALEFLASQGCTALVNLVLSRRDSLLADVRSTVPAEEVAHLRYSSLPEMVALLPSPLFGFSVDQDACGGERRSCSTDTPSAQDSSETCGGGWTTLLFNGHSIRPGFLGNLRRRVGQLDRWRLGWRVPLELDRPRNIRRLLPLLASLARRGRIARVRLPFPHPPEDPAAPEVKVKEPGKSRPDGTTLPLRVGGCLAPHWRRWQAIGAETWVVTFLWDGYHVPFLDSPPPLSRTPVSFPT